jgi:hypothetical protein
MLSLLTKHNYLIINLIAIINPLTLSFRPKGDPDSYWEGLCYKPACYPCSTLLVIL